MTNPSIPTTDAPNDVQKLPDETEDESHKSFEHDIDRTSPRPNSNSYHERIVSHPIELGWDVSEDSEPPSDNKSNDLTRYLRSQGFIDT